MDQWQEYQSCAVASLDRARTASSAEEIANLLDLAQLWTQLIERAAKNEHIGEARA
jgi:hypothetical protein